MAQTKHINIFAVGNVLDPHIRIEGKCRACSGGGCDRCENGRTGCLVRLSEVLPTVGPAMEFVGAEVASTEE